MYIDITGSRGQEVFKVGFGHTRLFFPEEFGVVLHVEEYAKQRQEARALKWELEEAKKYGLSLEEYRSQEKYIEKAKLANKDNEQENHPWQTGGGQEEEGAAAGVGPFGKNKESEKDKMSEAIMHVSTSEPLSEGRRQQEERAYELARQQSQHGGGDPTGYEVIKRGEVKPTDDNYSDVEPYHTVPEDHQQDVSPVSQGSQKPSLKAHHEEGYKSLSSYNTHHPYSPNLRHSPDPPADYRGGNHQGYNCDNQYRGHHDPPGHHDRRDPSHDPHHQFTVGSMVRVVAIQRGDPLYGVVQWIGILPDYPGTIAGVELEKTINGGTDGTRGGRRFFTCPYVIKDSNKEEMIKLKEEIHQLQRSIENLQLKKDTQQRTAKQQAEREKEQWKNDKQQLLEEQEHLREEIKEKLETDKERLREENGQLKYEIERLRREIIDLREAHRELQEETEKKEQVQAQLQSQVGLFSIENMRLKGQVKQLEEISATDIKYWEVSYKQVLTNKDTLGSGGWGKVEVGLLHGQKVAVKMLHSDIKSPYYNQLVRREISMLAKVRHPNLLLFIAGVLDHPSGSPIIITEPTGYLIT
uniref:CAP-Gly domain-containing protein n=1 Tax=Amphimedon queenslandica TaxID=400682 RepID=A0A1X7SSH7_AMPQE